MLKIILQSTRHIAPFNEPARDLRLQNTPLWLWQRNLLAPYVTREVEVPVNARLPLVREPMIVYRDNLWFDESYIRTFITEAVKRKRPVRAAYSAEDPAFREHALPLSTSYTPAGNLYLADLWYYPKGPEADAEPLVIDLQAREIGYYHVPTYMAGEQGDLVFQVPLRSMLAIDSWVHIFIADIVFGLFSRGARFEARLSSDLSFKLGILSKAIYEGRQVLKCSGLVQVGKNCTIDPSAVIHGPTTIGDNVTIGVGVVIDNSIIGNNVNISQGVQLMVSVVGDGTFLPFKAGLFNTTVMDNSMVAQNTCLPSNRPVLGGCVGHNCRIGAGMIVYPARTIESDVMLAASAERRVIDKDIKYEDSDHHKLRNAQMHKHLYPRRGEKDVESW
jgi:carbonic anhydrase/acetyltransferase-like protein (isoleucine patch superfamily)